MNKYQIQRKIPIGSVWKIIDSTSPYYNLILEVKRYKEIIGENVVLFSIRETYGKGPFLSGYEQFWDTVENILDEKRFERRDNDGH